MKYKVEVNKDSRAGCLTIFVGMLTIAFIVLKLCGVIAWSWWWVISPLLIYGAILFFILIVAMIFNVWRY